MLVKTLTRIFVLAAVFALTATGSAMASSDQLSFCPGEGDKPSEPTTFCPGEGDKPSEPTSFCPGEGDEPTGPNT
jgi:hypothetical protein